MDQILPSGQVVTLIHFVYDNGGQWRIACMPNMTEFHGTKYHPAVPRTNDHRAATCPACKKSSIFTAAQGAARAAKIT